MAMGLMGMNRLRVAACVAALLGPLASLGLERSAALSDDQLAEAGKKAERANLPLDAISAYETLLQRDAAYERILAPRLVDLHIASGQPAQALAWAKRVSDRFPHPRAYLAGVYARLGQWKESELMLRQALRSGTHVQERVPLLWQLAETQENQGNVPEALTTLSEACRAARGSVLDQTASGRLAALQERMRAVRPGLAVKSVSQRVEVRP